jgi:uncharacterized protein
LRVRLQHQPKELTMLCPTCNVELKMSERQQIEIDYCPQCRGVWLDRGELDKIIERSAQYEQAPRDDERKPYTADERYKYSDDERKRYTGDEHRHYDKRHHRKKSFLGDLLDF